MLRNRKNTEQIYCQYQPIESQWQELRRGKPVEEMLEAEGTAV